MGSRVDIFIIERNTDGSSWVRVLYAHDGSQDIPAILPGILEGDYNQFQTEGEGPMADCYAEAAVIVAKYEGVVLWCSDHSETVDGWQSSAFDKPIKTRSGREFRAREIACYCSIYFELARRKLWPWPTPKFDEVCRFQTLLRMEQADEEVERSITILESPNQEAKRLHYRMVFACTIAPNSEAVLKQAPPRAFRASALTVLKGSEGIWRSCKIGIYEQFADEIPLQHFAPTAIPYGPLAFHTASPGVLIELTIFNPTNKPLDCEIVLIGVALSEDENSH